MCAGPDQGVIEPPLQTVTTAVIDASLGELVVFLLESDVDGCEPAVWNSGPFLPGRLYGEAGALDALGSGGSVPAGSGALT